MRFVEFISYFLDDKTLWEMANVHPNKSGLKYHIHLYGKSGNTRHGPRVKVSNIAGKFDSSDNFSISIDHEPQIVSGVSKIKQEHEDHIKDWIKMNHDKSTFLAFFQFFLADFESPT